MRQLWVDAVGMADNLAGPRATDPPLYLTLPGAHGLDVQRLIDAGLLDIAENGAIAPQDVWKVVALETNNNAYTTLKDRLPGLRVLKEDIRGILASTERATLPRGRHRDWCRAHVVNMDLNSALRCEHVDDANEPIFPAVELIWKLAVLHRKRPALDWVLCLTLAAQIEWRLEYCEAVQRFLRENFQSEEQFAASSRALLGNRLFGALMSDVPVDLTALSGPEKQALLMVFVPKKIVTETYTLGWRIATTHNLRYGGHSRSQRMVSWVMQFKRDPRTAREPRAIYSESLSEALAGAGAIHPDGELHPS